MNITYIYKQFPNEADCYAFLEEQRWGGQPTCPYCKSVRSSRCKDGKRHHCASCNRSFSVLVGTVMQATKLPLQKWLLAMSLMLNAKKGIASRQLARDLDIHRNSAWLLQMRIRNAMAELSEWMAGSCLDRRRPSRKKTQIRPEPPAISAIKSRGSSLSASLTNRYGKTIRPAITQTLDQKNPIPGWKPPKSRRFFPSRSSGADRPRFFPVHSMEAFWYLLKRGLLGQYHQLDAIYLQAYMDEFAFKFQHRRNSDVFDLLVNRVVGNR